MSDDEYTPADVEIREDYIESASYDPYNYDQNWAARSARFDRWLAARKREWQAEAWDEGAASAAENIARARWEDGEPISNPYREPNA